MAYQHYLGAIDIGSSKIAVLIGQTNESFPDPEEPIRIVGAAKVASQGIKKGQIINIEAAVNSIIQAWEAAERMAGSTLNSVTVNINGTHIGSLNSKGVVAVYQPEVEITNQDVDRVIEAARAVSLPSSQQIIHVWPRFYTIDNQEGIKDPIGMSGVRLEVDTHIITASSTAIRNLSKSIQDAGLDVDQIVFSGLASSLAVLSPTEKELGVVLADIGADTTNICIYVEGAISYSAVIPVGSRHITKDLAAGLRISLEDAEKLKIFLSQLYMKRSQKEKRVKLDQEIDVSKLHIEGLNRLSYKGVVNGIIQPRLEEIFELILSKTKESGFIEDISGGLVITGGGSQTIEVDRVGKRVTGWSIKRAKPIGISGLIDDVQEPEFATAVGLLRFALNSNQEKGGELGLDLNFNRFIPNKLNLGQASHKLIELLKGLLP